VENYPVQLGRWPDAGQHFLMRCGDVVLSDCGNLIRCPVSTCGLVFRLATAVEGTQPVALAGGVRCPSGSHSYLVAGGKATIYT